MNEPKCSDCHWAGRMIQKERDGSALYYCRRYPPTMEKENGTEANPFPIVHSEDSCGEFEGDEFELYDPEEPVTKLRLAPVVAAWRPDAKVQCPNCGMPFELLGEDHKYTLFTPACRCWDCRSVQV